MKIETKTKYNPGEVVKYDGNKFDRIVGVQVQFIKDELTVQYLMLGDFSLQPERFVDEDDIVCKIGDDW